MEGIIGKILKILLDSGLYSTDLVIIIKLHTCIKIAV